jgi:hypothetical protein
MSKERLVDANKFYEKAEEHMVKETGAYSKGYNAALRAVKSDLHNEDATPTVDAAPVVHGYWKETPNVLGFIYCCSNCGGRYGAIARERRKYCCACGAKMDLE